jgi:hypothetical protein|tara:strand:- start:198 stop:386 length:189 start_codon:yes stop_codon:yes gene_type:complete
MKAAVRPSSQRGRSCGFLRSTGLTRSGFTTLRGALVMPLMTRGYKRGLIKFGLVTAAKPTKR